MSNQLDRLERRIGYQFKDQDLLVLALTHRSLGGRNNERLEFLGDSILNFAAAEMLFQHFPQAREGQLSRLRARSLPSCISPYPCSVSAQAGHPNQGPPVQLYA